MTNSLARFVRAARSNFYLPMRLMPAGQRKAMFAIYALARMLDDIADEPQSREEKRQAIEYWRSELDRIYHGSPTDPLGMALSDAVARYNLPRSEFESLIDGVVMDIDADMVAPTLAELDLYCRRVAGSIGMLALHVFGCDTRADKEFAISLGRALQLTNIARDIVEDGACGRTYIPREILDAAGISDVDPAKLIRHPRFGEVRLRVCELAGKAFTRAEMAFRACPRPRPLWPALAMMGIYRRMLAAIAAAPPNVGRVRIAWHAQLGVALRAMVLARP